MIGGHPAGLMQSVIQLRRMIVCCEHYDWFLQIPIGAGVDHSFYLFMLLRLLFMLLKFSCFIASWWWRGIGRQDSLPRVQTVQAGWGPEGWTRRRALGCQCNVAGAPSLPRYGCYYGILYPISTKSLISKENLRSPYIPILHRYRVRHQSFFKGCPYITILQYDIVPDIE